jgi:hypothetical protein
MPGDGKLSSRAIQLRLLRGRWRNPAVSRKRCSPSFGTRLHAGIVPRFGGEAQTFRFLRWSVPLATTKSGSPGSHRRLPLLLVAYFETVSVTPFLMRSALPNGEQR